MHAELSGQRDGATEPEEHVQEIENEGNDRHQAPRWLDRGGDEEQQGEHAEDGDEHAVVDDGRVAAVGFGDHVADDGHDEECPEELQTVIVSNHP